MITTAASTIPRYSCRETLRFKVTVALSHSYHPEFVVWKELHDSEGLHFESLCVSVWVLYMTVSEFLGIIVYLCLLAAIRQAECLSLCLSVYLWIFLHAWPCTYRTVCVGISVRESLCFSAGLPLSDDLHLCVCV